jgi:serine/threonine protein kinase
MIRKGSTVEERCSMDLTISTCGFSTIGTMSVDDTTSSGIPTTDLNNKYRFYGGLLSTTNDIDSARLLEEENDEDSEGSQPADDEKYAVKTLRNDLLGERKISGAIDLIIEAHFLSKLSHSHIVKLHGFGGVPGSADFSIVVDRVQENLSSAIHRFRRQRERLKLRGINRTGAKLEKKDKIVALQTDFDDRVVIARQLASALQYLHENS